MEAPRHDAAVGTPVGFDAAWLQQSFDAYLESVCRWVGSSEWPAQFDALFWFVRAIKSHPEITAQDVVAGHERLLQGLEHLGLDTPASLRVNLFSESGAVAFEATWRAVRFQLGIEPMTLAYEAAGTDFLKPPVRHLGRFGQFITVAALLQLQRPQRSILLPCHLLSEPRYFACEPESISRWIGLAIEDHLLALTKAHTFGRGTPRAAEYVFALHAFHDRVGELAARVGVHVSDEDLAWTRGMFDGSVRPS